VTTAQIAEQRADSRWQALLAFEVARTRALLQSGRPLVRALPWRLGLELSAVIAGGTRILDRIAAVGGDVFAHRPVLRTWDWCAVAYHALVPTGPSAGKAIQ
jgi:phytoene/squalene synthetase